MPEIYALSDDNRDSICGHYYMHYNEKIVDRVLKYMAALRTTSEVYGQLPVDVHRTKGERLGYGKILSLAEYLNNVDADEEID